MNLLYSPRQPVYAYRAYFIKITVEPCISSIQLLIPARPDAQPILRSRTLYTGSLKLVMITRIHTRAIRAQQNSAPKLIQCVFWKKHAFIKLFNRKVDIVKM